MARPTILNEELIAKFHDKLAKGMPISYVCDLLYVTRGSYQNWITKGEDDLNNEVDSIYAVFFESIKNAQAMYVEKACDLINDGRQNWQSIAWWLERTRQEFMPKQQIQADDEGKVTVVIGGKPKYDNNKR